MSNIKRSFEEILEKRLQEKPKFIQCILGPRQVGKTTGVLSVLKKNFKPTDYLYQTAEGEISNSEWLRDILSQALQQNKKILVVDEIQKIENWNEIIKKYWDDLKQHKTPMHLVLLGSSSLKLTMGLSESLAGRYEVIWVEHWNYQESYKLQKMNLETYLDKGGYPGSYELLQEPKRFRKYLIESVFENVIQKDILRFAQVKKPALFRQTFHVLAKHPAQVISYNKIMGQLLEAGNVDQVKYYLDLYEQAFLIKLIFKFSTHIKSRTSSPKILVRAPVLSSLFFESISDETRGRIFESTVGSRLIESFDPVYYWAEANHEVDFVVTLKNQVYAIEVKLHARASKSLEAFRKKFPKAKSIIIHSENYLEFEKNPEEFISKFSI